MKGELHHARNPHHTYIRWAIFYTVILLVSIGLFFIVTSRIRTYTIPSGALELSVPYKKYLVGESISFTLKNNYNSAIYVENECPAEPLTVYRREGTDWVRVHDKAAAESCTSKQRQISVPSNSQQSGTFDAWPHLFEKPGLYRIVAHVDYFNAVPYQDFEIITKPEVIATKPAPAATSTQRQTSTNQTPTKTNSPAATAAPTTPTQAATQPSLADRSISLASGSIAVQYSATMIYVRSVTPAAGCTYEGGRSGNSVEVQFKCAGDETEVKLSLVNGQLIQRVEN